MPVKPRYRTYVLYRYIVGKSYGTGRQVSPLPRYLGACVYILVTILVTEEHTVVSIIWRGWWQVHPRYQVCYV